MNIRFAEECRDKPLEFSEAEWDVFYTSRRDGRTEKDLEMKCQKDIFLGVFFDGTNNNKYRDTLGFSHSNVARLYEVYPGTPAGQTAPKFLPRVNPGGSKTERPIFPDKAFKPASVPPEDLPYYREIYVPGLGTPMPDGADSGTGTQKSGGLAMALLGQVRLDWAMLQLLNQVHAAVFKQELAPRIDMAALLKRGAGLKGLKGRTSSLPVVDDVMALQEMVSQELQQYWNNFETLTGTYDSTAFDQLLHDCERRLAEKLTQYGDNLPKLRKIRLSVFGFSRGATEARAWVNRVVSRWSASPVAKTSTCQGIPLQIDFLGIFDTVASVGLAQVTPNLSGGTFEGHAAWADEAMMPVPPQVRRCTHLVAAMEVRGAFPLDSVCRKGMLPSNCKEIVYPGMHSDVGGGYPPDDQGRSLGQGAAGDKFKLSQIALAQMYREARMAGVPLAPERFMLAEQKLNFAIAPQLRDDFNAYVAATRTGTVSPTQGTGHARFASMFPTETQPREELHRVMRRHAGYSLRWRKAMLGRLGGISGLPGLRASKSELRFQDTEDFRGAEEELRKEIKFLSDPDPQKFQVLDDLFFDTVLDTGRKAGQSLLHAGARTGSGLAVFGGSLVLLASWLVENKSLVGIMKAKQEQWDSWLREEWYQSGPGALPIAADRFMERYVHDSRAWFKPFMRTDGKKGTFPSMVPDDEAWFVLGGREQERLERMAALKGEVAAHQKAGNQREQARAEVQLEMLQQEGQPLLVGGREPYRMWGYLRHRTLYQGGRLDKDSAATWAQEQAKIQKEEDARFRKKLSEDSLAVEKAEHDAEIKRLKESNQRVLNNKDISTARKDEHTESVRNSIAREKARHQVRMKAIQERVDAAAKEAN